MRLILVMAFIGATIGEAAQVSGSTPTQAVISYSAPSASACIVEVSESTTYTPPVNDVNASLFPGANTDVDAVNGALAAGARVLVVGKRTTQQSGGRLYSRALRADTEHYVRITCDGQTQVTQFRTTPIAGLVPAESAFQPDGHGNWGMPDFDWTDRTKPVIDPLTGAAIYRLTDPSDAGFQENRNFVAQFGGSGWTNPANALSGSTASLAATTNMNALFLAVDTTLSTVYGGFAANDGWPYPRMSALATRIFGSGTDGNFTNRQMDVCLSVDSGQTCYTSSIRVTLPQNTSTEIGIFPAQFPTANFTGWGKPVSAEYWTTIGYVSVNGNTVTLTKSRDGQEISNDYVKNASAWFRPEWTPGTKIFITGSAPTCANNYCTIVGVQGRTALTISESLSIGDALYKSAALGVRISKTSLTGSVSISASSRIAAYMAHHTGAAEMCSSLPVTTSVDRQGNPLGRSIKGRLCVIARARDFTGRLYFIGESEPEVRLLSMNAIPNSIPNHTNAESPAGGGFLTLPIPFWSKTDPNVYFLRVNTNAGSPAVFRLTYNGDYRENASAFWSFSPIGLVTAQDPVKWENMFKGTKDPRAQILARTAYDETRWPSLGNLAFGGMVEGKFFFYNLLSSQDLPCAVFTFDSVSGDFERWFDTLRNGMGGFKFAGCHGLKSYGNRIFISAHTLTSANTAVKYGGPFVAPLTHVMRNGSASTNTALPEWTDGSYDSSCPTDILQLHQNMGATGNECVTVRVAGEPCSASAEANEKAWTPCPWDPNRSWIGRPVEPGDVIQDFEKSINPGADSDSEYMLVLKRRDLGNGAFELVLLRDSATGYNCLKDRPRGRSCVNSRGQAQHTNGWNLFFRPISGLLLYDPLTGSIEVENDAVGRGHFDIVPLPEGRHTFVGITADGYGTRVNSDSFAFAPVNIISQYPRFAGITQSNNFTQSYISAPSPTATGMNATIANDWRHINSPFGADWENPNQSVGGSLTYTLQPGTTSVYKISSLNGSFSDYKRERLIGWAGLYVMGEKSGPGILLTDNDAWQFCYAYRDGECRSAAVAGDVYAVIPALETSIPTCRVSQISFRTACLFSTGSVQTQVTQLRMEKKDPVGLRQRALGHALTRPAAQYVYSSVRMFGDSTKVLATVHHHNGWFTGAVMIDPGRIPTDAINRTTFRPIEVSGIPSAAVVEFGYNTNFYCSARREVCRVSAETIDETRPFAYEHESLASSTSGKVTIPALPGRVLYYRVVTNGAAGPVNVLAVK